MLELNLHDECCFPGKLGSGGKFLDASRVKSMKKDACELLPNCVRQLSLHTTLLGLFPMVTTDI